MKLSFIDVLSAVFMFYAAGVFAQAEWVVESESNKVAKRDSSQGGAPVERFATLEAAVAKLKEVRAAAGRDVPGGGVTIRLLAGVHRLSVPLALGKGESGEPGAPMSLVGPSDKSAVISGGRVLQTPSSILDAGALQRLPLKSRERVVQFDLHKEGIREFGELIRRGWGQTVAAGQLELFFGGKPMTLARWPNQGHALLRTAKKGNDEDRSFLVDGLNLQQLSKEPAVWATGYWGEDWAEETIPVESIDVRLGVVKLQSPGPQLGIKAGHRMFVQNALSELDEPGEWYLDRPSGILYFWPPAPIRKGDVEVSVLPSLVVTQGASHLRFSGLTFEMARGDAFAINGGSNVVVENSTIRNVGGRAANVGGSDNRMSDVDVYDTGEGGVYLWGGDRRTLTPAHLSAENCRIRRFNRLARTARPAIQLNGVGNRAIGNVISDGTHNAIRFFGNDHLIAFNDISKVALETGDVGAIYTGRDWTARGTVIRNNYLHDIHGPGRWGSRGVYLDDQASGIVVKGNLFINVDRPVFIGGGRDNLVEGNVMISSSPAVHVDERGLTWQSELTKDSKGALRKRLFEVPFNQPPYRDRYPNLATLLDDEPGAPKYNVIRRNTVIGGKPLDLTEGAQRWVAAETTLEMGAVAVSPSEAATAGKTTSGVVASALALYPGALSVLPTEVIECVSNKWQKIDSGDLVTTCDTVTPLSVDSIDGRPSR